MTDLLQTSSCLSQCFEKHLLSATNSDIKPATVHALWQDIATRYNEKQRAYHTLRHLQQLFAQFEQVKHKLNEPHIIALALFYHDVVYDPLRTDNERKSAEYAAETLRPYLCAEQCEHLYALIMMTTNHQLTGLSDPDEINDAAYLLDMDLSILAAPWPQYERYAQAVRQEYSHVSLAEYRTGRMEVLNRLLAHPTLYLTCYYYERLETPARANIQRELTLLAT
ncbi:HD domain-containing protein [Psychrobacter celer]|uniref:HD domain-containing protein n=1 Tax=Psychrobacter celer TaxID=306572 RepID=UPI003FD63852